MAAQKRRQGVYLRLNCVGIDKIDVKKGLMTHIPLTDISGHRLWSYQPSYRGSYPSLKIPPGMTSGKRNFSLEGSLLTVTGQSGPV